MSEGELKKRMRKLGQKYHPEEGFWGNSKNPDYFGAKGVFQVLDEAAKEFPQPPTDDSETSFLRKMWFRKWFGEKEK